MKILECVWSFEMYKIGQISCRANLSVRGGKAAVRKGELVDPTHALLIPGFRIQSPQNLVWVPRAAACSIWGSPVQLTSLFPITSPKLWISTQVLEVPLFWATPCLNTRWEAVGTEWKVIPPGEVAWSLGKHSMTDLVWGSFGHQPILSHGRLRAVPCRSQAKCPISSVSKYFLEGHILRGAGKSLFRRLFPLHVFNLSEGREASGDTGEVMLRREGKKKIILFPLCFLLEAGGVRHLLFPALLALAPRPWPTCLGTSEQTPPSDLLSLSPQQSWAPSSAREQRVAGRGRLPPRPGDPAGPSAAPARPWWIKSVSTSATWTSSGSTLQSESLEGILTLGFLPSGSTGDRSPSFSGYCLAWSLKVAQLTTGKCLCGQNTPPEGVMHLGGWGEHLCIRPRGECSRIPWVWRSHCWGHLWVSLTCASHGSVETWEAEVMTETYRLSPHFTFGKN